MPGPGPGTAEAELRRTQSVSSKSRGGKHTGTAELSSRALCRKAVEARDVGGGGTSVSRDLGFGRWLGVHQEKEGRGWGRVF